MSFKMWYIFSGVQKSDNYHGKNCLWLISGWWSIPRKSASVCQSSNVWSCYQYWPIRGQYSGHMISIDQLEASSQSVSGLWVGTGEQPRAHNWPGSLDNCTLWQHTRLNGDIDLQGINTAKCVLLVWSLCQTVLYSEAKETVSWIKNDCLIVQRWSIYLEKDEGESRHKLCNPCPFLLAFWLWYNEEDWWFWT